MDAQIVSLMAFLLAAGAALIAIRKRNGITGDNRVAELEDEVRHLMAKVNAQDVLIDGLLQRATEQEKRIVEQGKKIAEQEKFISDLSGENSALIESNERLLKRLTSN